jgi:hypothetical protein
LRDELDRRAELSSSSGIACNTLKQTKRHEAAGIIKADWK